MLYVRARYLTALKPILNKCVPLKIQIRTPETIFIINFTPYPQPYQSVEVSTELSNYTSKTKTLHNYWIELRNPLQWSFNSISENIEKKTGRWSRIALTELQGMK
jgi:hypothetical protein